MWEYTHRSSGYVASALALVVILLGLYTVGLKPVTPIRPLATAWVGVVVLCFCCREAVHQLRFRKQQHRRVLTAENTVDSEVAEFAETKEVAAGGGAAEGTAACEVTPLT